MRKTSSWKLCRQYIFYTSSTLFRIYNSISQWSRIYHFESHHFFCDWMRSFQHNAKLILVPILSYKMVSLVYCFSFSIMPRILNYSHYTTNQMMLYSPWCGLACLSFARLLIYFSVGYLYQRKIQSPKVFSLHFKS